MVHDVSVRPIEDWAELRATRLRAVGDSPRAFVGDLATEEMRTAGQWRTWLSRGRWLCAVEGGATVGLLNHAAARDAPHVRHVESVWVAADRRRRGIARLLLDSVAREVRPCGVTELVIWVLDDNSTALEAYLRLGFSRTGERQHLPGLPGRLEERLVRRL